MKMPPFESIMLKSCATATAIATAAIMITPGLAQARSDRADDPARTAIAAVCKSVMRLSPGTTGYGACTDSLSETAHRIGDAQATTQARQDCLQSGSGAGQGLALCMVDRIHSAAPSQPTFQVAGAPGGGKSYPYMSFKEQRASEERSCATLGLEPGSGGFASCVASLDASLLDADVSSH